MHPIAHACVDIYIYIYRNRITFKHDKRARMQVRKNGKKERKIKRAFSQQQLIVAELERKFAK